jgi:flagellar biosynthetic protein FliQ
MEPQLVMDIVRQSIMLMIKLAGPVMMAGLAVGLVIALLQALTQIQEMTLAFVPKIMIIFLMVFMFIPEMMAQMSAFMEILSDQIIGAGRS